MMTASVASPLTCRLTTIVVFAVSIFFASASAFNAQTCPTHIGPVPLNNRNSARVSCTTTEGRTICSLWCDYSETRSDGGFQGASIKFQWVAKQLRAGAPKLEDSCAPGLKIPNGQRHATNQAIIRWSGTNPTLDQYAEIAAGLMLMRTGENAVACEGEPPPPDSGLPLPPIEPYCKGTLPAARFMIVSGTVDVYQHALNRWKGPFTAGIPLYRCDWIRTAADSEAVVMIYTPSGAEDRINMMPDTILEIPGDPNYTEPEATFVDLVKGTIKWFSAEPTQTRPPSPFNVRTPTITTGRRGTEFVIRHDEVTKKDYVFLNSGSLEVSGGGVKTLLTAGQQLFAEKGWLSPVSQMPADVWTAASAKRVASWDKLFTNVGSAPNDKGDHAGKRVAKEEPVEMIGGLTGQTYTISFRGRSYRTLYQRQDHEGNPIEVYFFEMIGPDGQPVSQDGAKLWGRFVKQPSPKGGVDYWFVEWIFRSGRWEIAEARIENFQPIRGTQK